MKKDPDRLKLIPRNQFMLSSLFLVVTLICATLAVAAHPESIVARISGVVIAANLLGAIAAIVVTWGFGFPRDGSYRHKEDE